MTLWLQTVSCKECGRKWWYRLWRLAHCPSIAVSNWRKPPKSQSGQSAFTPKITAGTSRPWIKVVLIPWTWRLARVHTEIRWKHMRPTGIVPWLMSRRTWHCVRDHVKWKLMIGLWTEGTEGVIHSLPRTQNSCWEMYFWKHNVMMMAMI